MYIILIDARNWNQAFPIRIPESMALRVTTADFYVPWKQRRLLFPARSARTLIANANQTV